MTAGSVGSSGSLKDAAVGQKGLSPMVAAVFITGMVAGSGMLALANAVKLTGQLTGQMPRWVRLVVRGHLVHDRLTNGPPMFLTSFFVPQNRCWS